MTFLPSHWTIKRLDMLSGVTRFLGFFCCQQKRPEIWPVSQFQRSLSQENVLTSYLLHCVFVWLEILYSHISVFLFVCLKIEIRRLQMLHMCSPRTPRSSPTFTLPGCHIPSFHYKSTELNLFIFTSLNENLALTLFFSQSVLKVIISLGISERCS